MAMLYGDRGFCIPHSGTLYVLAAGSGADLLRIRCQQKLSTRIGSILTGCSPVWCSRRIPLTCGQCYNLFLDTHVPRLASRDHDCVDSGAPSCSTLCDICRLAGGRLRRVASSLPNPVRSGLVVRMSDNACVWTSAFAALVLVLQLSLYSACANAAQFESLAAMKFLWEPKVQVEPAIGTCATCIGVVDETLGSCNAVANCVSSFDDRPIFFVAPWEFPGELGAAARDLKRQLRDSGATIKEEEGRYIHATVSGDDGVVDDIEFLFSDPSSDATVCIRAASRAVDYDDHGRNRTKLEQLRKALRWDEVPILRNRVRKLFFIESPWDTFGPEPPPTFYYKDALDFAPE